MTRFALSILAAAALLAAVPAAQAAERETQSANVSLKGVNRTTPAGQALLLARLKAAARQVCGSADSGSAAELADMQACRAQALANAMPQGTELAAITPR